MEKHPPFTVEPPIRPWQWGWRREKFLGQPAAAGASGRRACADPPVVKTPAQGADGCGKAAVLRQGPSPNPRPKSNIRFVINEFLSLG
ncbi:unnamed protein product [Nesidiocoris tenuis]|uniref:Uncharacterized protein n=1 Tax=Nesidiocoris tenuis TaxID=355587 RepID=A0A6H5GFN9_9HEMI|nr:unnamed protein product [Nesidiocoris tenuis]